jgi:choline kinase
MLSPTAVTIAEPEESISPMMRGESKQIDDFDLDRNIPKKHRAKVASRLTGRASIERLPKSRYSTTDATPEQGYESTTSTRPESINDHEGLISRVAAWIKHEKSRRAAHKARRKSEKGASHTTAPSLGLDGAADTPNRRASDASEGAVALEQLQEILAGLSASDKPTTRRGQLSKRVKSAQKLRRVSTAASSDVDLPDLDPIAPSCDVILDNSQTLSYSGGEVEMEDGFERRPSLIRVTSTMQKDAWETFKYEIVRLAHTLRLKGWRRVPMGMSSQIGVERLSGALTNAVYVVSPPVELPTQATTDTADGTISAHPKFSPPYVASCSHRSVLPANFNKKAASPYLRFQC